MRLRNPLLPRSVLSKSQWYSCKMSILGIYMSWKLKNIKSCWTFTCFYILEKIIGDFSHNGNNAYFPTANINMWHNHKGFFGISCPPITAPSTRIPGIACMGDKWPTQSGGINGQWRLRQSILSFINPSWNVGCITRQITGMAVIAGHR